VAGVRTAAAAGGVGLRVGSFFFQAEDGIRDFHVTGVQTCALPILRWQPSDRIDVNLIADYTNDDRNVGGSVLLLRENADGTIAKIGRASWRERVGSTAAAVPWQRRDGRSCRGCGSGRHKRGCITGD